MTQETEINKQPAIDWALSIKLAAGKESIAKELLAMFLDQLPQERQDIQQAFENKDFTVLENLVHKLHGGTCYCGVPALKSTAKELETSLKTGQYQLVDAQVQALDQQIMAVMEAAAELSL